MSSILTITSAATQANRRLCTLAAVKVELSISGSADDTALTALIDGASAAIASHCRRVLAEETVQEVWRSVYQGPDAPLILARVPVSAVASVAVDGATLDGADYEIDPASGLLWRLADDARAWWSAAKVTVTYTAGYRVPDQANPTLPEDISRAAVLAVSAWHLGQGRDPMLRSETEDGVGGSSWVATDATRILPPQVISALEGGGHIMRAV